MPIQWKPVNGGYVGAIRSLEYGIYAWIHECSGEFTVFVNSSGYAKPLKICKSLSAAKAWVTRNLLYAGGVSG